jgi:SH3-like domain-containing protein
MKIKQNGIAYIFKISMLTVALVAWSATIALSAEFVSVNKDGVNVRSGPSTSNEVLFKFPLGYPLKVIDRQDKWLKVSDFEGDKGWIFETLVSKTPYVIVKVKEGNVRSDPGTNFAKVGSVAREVILKKLEQQGSWIKVSHPRLTGWVHDTLVWP